MWTALLLALAPAWAQTVTEPGPTVIDRVVVVVGGEVLTASDLRLSVALDARDTLAVPQLAEPADDPLQRLIDRSILRGMAGQVEVYQPDETDVRSRLETLTATWTDLSDYRRFLLLHGLDESRLQRRLADRMTIERYIRRNFTVSREDGGPPSVAQYNAWMDKLRAGVRVRRVPERTDLP